MKNKYKKIQRIIGDLIIGSLTSNFVGTDNSAEHLFDACYRCFAGTQEVIFVLVRYQSYGPTLSRLSGISPNPMTVGFIEVRSLLKCE